MIRIAQPACLALVLVTLGCPPAPVADAGVPDDDDDVVTLDPPPPGEGFQLSMTATAPAQKEIWVCDVIPELSGDTLFHYVNRAEAKQSPGVHHADVMTFFFTGLSLAPGRYACDELYATYPEIMEDGIFLFGSQTAETTIQLPPGVAAPLPREAAYMFEIHFVNASDEEREITSILNGWTIPEDDVEETIWGTVHRDFEIAVPAGAVDHQETNRCVFNQPADILFLSSHTHELATHFSLRRFDGENVGEVVYENDDWHSPLIQDFDPPLHVEAGEGFEYTCLYTNPRDVDVGWGFNASDEMCQFGYVFIPGDRDIECETVAIE